MHVQLLYPSILYPLSAGYKFYTRMNFVTAPELPLTHLAHWLSILILVSPHWETTYNVPATSCFHTHQYIMYFFAKSFIQLDKKEFDIKVRSPAFFCYKPCYCTDLRAFPCELQYCPLESNQKREILRSKTSAINSVVGRKATSRLQRQGLHSKWPHLQKSYRPNKTNSILAGGTQSQEFPGFYGSKKYTNKPFEIPT
jgi:hypothetical protein